MANECCYRSDGYEEIVKAFALKKLQAAIASERRLADELAEALTELRRDIAAASLVRNEGGKRIRETADKALAKHQAARGTK